MAKSNEGSRGRRRIKDEERAAYMRRMNIYRSTGICPVCYRTVRIDAWWKGQQVSRFTHVCR
jgi:hypothetical protein